MSFLLDTDIYLAHFIYTLLLVKLYNIMYIHLREQQVRATCNEKLLH